MNNGKESPILTKLTLPPQELVICCGRQHRLRRKNSLTLENLNDYTLLLPADTTITEIIQESKITLSNSIQSEHAPTLMNLAALNCGLALLPENIAITNDELNVIPLDPSIFVIPTIFSKTGRPLSHAAATFLEIAQKGGYDHA